MVYMYVLGDTCREIMDSMLAITTTNPKSRIGGKAHDRNPTVPHTLSE